MKSRIYSTFIMALVAVGCAVRPPVIEPIATPDEYIFASEGDTTLVVGVGWWEIFGDTTLNSLMLRAVENNTDLKVAASRVVEAQSQLGIARASLLPSVDVAVGGSATYQEGATGKKEVEQQYSLLPKASWEINIFGGIAATMDAARAELLASEWGYRAVMLSLQASVAESYFQWLQYARSLEIAERSLSARLQAQERIDSLYLYGFSSGADLQQAISLTASIAADIPTYHRAMAQTNIALSTLLGESFVPLPSPPHTSECVHTLGTQLDGLYCGHLTAAQLPIYIPVGLPSAMLERRPDVQEAFYNVEAAAANTRLARAQRLPSVGLTAEGGVLAASLKGLTAHNPLYWAATLDIAQPLIGFGRLKRAEEVAVEQWRQASLNYHQSVLQAVADVENALVAIATYNGQVEHNITLLEANRKLQVISTALYAEGMADYIDVTDAERNLYDAQINYVGLMTNQLLSYVALYKALGGGW